MTPTFTIELTTTSIVGTVNGPVMIIELDGSTVGTVNDGPVFVVKAE